MWYFFGEIYPHVLYNISYLSEGTFPRTQNMRVVLAEVQTDPTSRYKKIKGINSYGPIGPEGERKATSTALCII